MFAKLRGGRISIRYKLVVLFLAVALIPLAIATIVARDRSENALLVMGRQNQEARAQGTTRVIDEYLASRIGDVGAASFLPEIREFATGAQDVRSREHARGTLLAFQKKDVNYEAVALVDPKGTVIVSSLPSEEGTNLLLRASIQDALSGRPGVSDAAISLTTGRPALDLTSPIRGDAGQVLGAVRIQTNLGGILKRITDDAKIFGKGSTAALVDEYGFRLALSDARFNFTNAEGGLIYTSYQAIPEAGQAAMIKEQRFGKGTNANSFTVKPQPELASAVGTGKQGSATLKDESGKTEVLSFATMGNKPWKYIVTTPESAFTASANATTRLLTIVGLIAAAAATLVALFFSLTMTRPIVRLAKAADAVSMGDTDASVDVSSNDEIGDLASAFDRMVTSVRFYMGSFNEDSANEDALTGVL